MTEGQDSALNSASASCRLTQGLQTRRGLCDSDMDYKGAILSLKPYSEYVPVPDEKYRDLMSHTMKAMPMVRSPYFPAPLSRPP